MTYDVDEMPRSRSVKIPPKPSSPSDTHVRDPHSAQSADADWRKCADAHIRAIQRDGSVKLTDEARKLVEGFQAVVLEILPPNKRFKLEIALDQGLVEQVALDTPHRTLVVEKSGFSTLFAPAARIVDLLRG